MDLATGVSKYLEVARGFGRPMHLSGFGLPRAETEKMVSSWDEDYHISRYIVLSREKDDALGDLPVDARVYLINGFECSHLTFQPGVEELL